MTTTYIKDPSAVLDYVWDWTDWLATGETISSAVFTLTTGLTKDSQAIVAGRVTAWISGGTADYRYSVACKITTSVGRVDERTILIDVEDR